MGGCISRVNSWQSGVISKQSHCVWNMFYSCVVNIYFITPVFLNLWSYVTVLYPVISLCSTSVGVFMNYDLYVWCFQSFLLKLIFLSIIVCAEIFGLRLEGLIVFNVICDCSRSLPHRFIGDILSITLIHETKWFLRFLIALFAAFLLCMLGGANWYSIRVFVKKIMLRMPHCLASGIWVETLFLLGNCEVWSSFA